MTVPREGQESVKRDCHVLSAQGHGADVRIRALADRVPAAGRSVPCEPTAWDGYMELLRRQEQEVGE